MSTQIAVRLPDDVVAFVDDLVASGEASSRAQVVSHALERERRRRVALRDIEILKAGTEDGLAGLAEYAARLPRPELD
jgi:Arc/MetJ-type ribon-helix-helix transcriptional regulator